MVKLKKISNYEWEIPKEEGMIVPGKIFSDKKLLNKEKDDFCIDQIKRVAKLPGIINYSFAMPDFHQGYGFSIGAVAAFDIKNGVVSPEGVGYDINCGIRALVTNIDEEEFLEKKEQFVKKLMENIRIGNNPIEESFQEIDKILKLGAKRAIEKGFGKKEDLEFCEENGRIKIANPKDVSNRAKERAKFQVGTLGSGNHFIEFGKVEKIFDWDVAKKFNLSKNKICVLIHTGSRALGHQVASDYVEKIRKQEKNQEISYCKINSKIGKEYLSAMNCAANFAFYNRQIIMNEIRKVFEKFFPKRKSNLLYDVCHNIAKIEKHKIGKKVKKILVIRKGATRSFGPGRKEIPKKYFEIGQPVIVPGSMGTYSYFLIGTKDAEEKSFGSCAHGAGRELSRFDAIKKLNVEKIMKEMNNKNIQILCQSKKAIVEEAPEAYKEISQVIKVIEKNKLAKKIARIKPLIVIKG